MAVNFACTVQSWEELPKTQVLGPIGPHQQRLALIWPGAGLVIGHLLPLVILMYGQDGGCSLRGNDLFRIFYYSFRVQQSDSVIHVYLFFRFFSLISSVQLLSCVGLFATP